MLGCSHVPGIDCGSTLVPVCRLQRIRMVLAIAAKLDYEVYMLDLQTKFLNADVEEEVFVKVPRLRAQQQIRSSTRHEAQRNSLRFPAEPKELVQYNGLPPRQDGVSLS